MRYTVGELQASLDVDGKTLKEWMSRLGVTPEQDKYDGRRWYVEEADALRVAAAHARQLRPIGRALPRTLPEAHRRILALEEEIAQLHEQVAAHKPVERVFTIDDALRIPSRSRAPSHTPPIVAASRPGDSGPVARRLAGRLGLQHGANSVASVIDWNAWTESERLANRTAALTTIRNYLALHPRAGDWRECDDPACECHALSLVAIQ